VSKKRLTDQPDFLNEVVGSEAGQKRYSNPPRQVGIGLSARLEKVRLDKQYAYQSQEKTKDRPGDVPRPPAVPVKFVFKTGDSHEIEKRTHHDAQDSRDAAEKEDFPDEIVVVIVGKVGELVNGSLIAGCRRCCLRVCPSAGNKFHQFFLFVCIHQTAEQKFFRVGIIAKSWWPGLEHNSNWPVPWDTDFCARQGLNAANLLKPKP